MATRVRGREPPLSCFCSSPRAGRTRIKTFKFSSSCGVDDTVSPLTTKVRWFDAVTPFYTARRALACKEKDNCVNVMLPFVFLLHPCASLDVLTPRRRSRQYCLRVDYPSKHSMEKKATPVGSWETAPTLKAVHRAGTEAKSLLWHTIHVQCIF